MKKILAVFAHPDDEAFGPGGTLAKYARQGTEIHLLCATRGEMGQFQEGSSQNQKEKIHQIREKELLKSAGILGVKKVEFLGFSDGYLGNAIYHKLADKIIRKINAFAPQIVITLDRLGVSGHLDHIAVSMITTYAFLKTDIPSKLYYFCLPQTLYDKKLTEYFIYFPEGYDEGEITSRIDYSEYWQIKKKAMIEHNSQAKDVKRLIARYHKWPKTDFYRLLHYRHIKPQFPESDLFAKL